jgi:Fe-S cluster biogenesis protein NfuA
LLAPALKDAARTTLAALGLVDRSLPAAYTPGPVPPLPALDEAPARPAAPVQAATPVGFEPGLMEDVLGAALSREAVEQVLDELVRPALNADGGDITLVDIRGGDVYVKLVGACNTCPSSVMTMRMGVERLLQEEFPEMGELIQVDAGY